MRSRGANLSYRSDPRRDGAKETPTDRQDAELAAALIGGDTAAAGQAAGEIFARAGETEPQRALAALARARQKPELASVPELWLPDLCVAARPAYGIEALVALTEAYRDHFGQPLELQTHRSVPRVLGNSNFLARTLAREPGWTAELRDGDAGEPMPGAPDGAAPPADWGAIRGAKYRGLLRIAARDLSGRPLYASLRELSDLADACLEAALLCASAERGAELPALFALGKLGGRELNLSSDVDLLFLYEGPGGEAGLERNHEVAGIARALRQGLEHASPQGFGYRVDLELRPEGRSGALANSVHGALSYYESFGAEWERQAFLRLRHVTGAPTAARAFEAGIEPFVYRRAISPDTLGAVRDMKYRIERERRSAGRDIDYDLKEGPGGIRDVEFLVQALQLLFGGRDPSVRTGNVLDALEALTAAAALPESIAASLAAAYTWLRRAEHAIQLAEERQTQQFPRDPGAQLALARRLGDRDPCGDTARARLMDEWTATRSEVRAHFDRVLPDSGEAAE
jgi:glutamate-ammonia-ligase adenylyltransferase